MIRAEKSELGEEGAIALIELEDTLYTKREKDRVYIETQLDTFRAPESIQDWFRIYKFLGLPYEIADRPELINTVKIKSIDVRDRIAYFDDSPTKKSKRCLLSQENMKKILNVLKTNGN